MNVLKVYYNLLTPYWVKYSPQWGRGSRREGGHERACFVHVHLYLGLRGKRLHINRGRERGTRGSSGERERETGESYEATGKSMWEIQRKWVCVITTEKREAGGGGERYHGVSGRSGRRSGRRGPCSVVGVAAYVCRDSDSWPWVGERSPKGPVCRVCRTAFTLNASIQPVHKKACGEDSPEQALPSHRTEWPQSASQRFRPSPQNETCKKKRMFLVDHCGLIVPYMFFQYTVTRYTVSIVQWFPHQD